MQPRYLLGVVFCSLTLFGCGGASSSSALPPQAGSVRVRFAEGAPLLETLIDGVPTDIGLAYLQVDGRTVATSFPYGTITPFTGVSAGKLSLRALDEAGYAVGPLMTPMLMAGGRYSLVLVGTYPNYRVLAFTEPSNGDGAWLSFYEASPMVPQSDFGRFAAKQRTGFQQLGNAKFGSLATVTLGKRVTNTGGYAGPTSKPLGALTAAQINAFDRRNVLPFHQAARLSLFLFDPKSGSAQGPLFGSLDQ
jgi:hypothetical protein